MAGYQVGKPIPVTTPLTPEPGAAQRANGVPVPLSESGAPSGYKWDSVQGKYVRTSASLGVDAADYSKNAMAGLSGAMSSYGTGMSTAGYNPSSTWMGSPQITAPTVSGSSASGFMPQVAAPGTPPPTATTASKPGQVSTAINLPSIGSIQAPNMDAANAAEFGKAKDQVGQESASALDSLKGEMARRGILGSGSETRGMERVFQSGQQQLGDTSRQQAINNAALQEQNALAGYQGNISMRGQDLSARAAEIQAQMQQRGQDMSFDQAMAQAALEQRGQDIGVQEAGYQGGITQRGQDLSTSTTQRGQDIGLAETGYQGGITQRGQDLSSSNAAQDRANQLLLQQNDIAARQRQAMLSGLGAAY